jgi:hypothetical protein
MSLHIASPSIIAFESSTRNNSVAYTELLTITMGLHHRDCSSRALKSSPPLAVILRFVVMTMAYWISLCCGRTGVISSNSSTGCCDAWAITPTMMGGGNRRSGKVMTYRYFGYGSNVLPSTMKALRGIDVVQATAAILPDYELRFYGMAGGRNQKQLLESSAAFVQPSSSSSKSSPSSSSSSSSLRSVVHGVLYTLTADDFAKVGQTEGVPWSYRWQRCEVYPYEGDGERAGATTVGWSTADEVDDDDDGNVKNKLGVGVEAYTLVPPPRLQRQDVVQVPPSASYLGLIQEGARLWKFDRHYQTQLANIEVASNLLIRDGVSEWALRLAERATGTDRTYMIGGTKTETTNS